MRRDRLIRIGSYLLGALGLVATLLGITAVTSRYVIDLPVSFSDEIVTYLIVWAFLLGIGLGEAENVHIRATILLDALTPRWRWALNLFCCLVTIGFATILVWYGAAIVEQRHMLGEVSTTVLRFPQWIARLCIPIGFSLVILAALYNLVAALRDRKSGTD